MKNLEPLPPFKLSVWRDSMGYSLEDTASALGAEVTLVKAWDKETRDVPKYIKLACMALALGIKD